MIFHSTICYVFSQFNLISLAAIPLLQPKPNWSLVNRQTAVSGSVSPIRFQGLTPSLQSLCTATARTLVFGHLQPDTDRFARMPRGTSHNSSKFGSQQCTAFIASFRFITIQTLVPLFDSQPSSGRSLCPHKVHVAFSSSLSGC